MFISWADGCMVGFGNSCHEEVCVWLEGDVFDIDINQLEKTLWFEVEITSTKEGDFFYKKQIDYSKKQKAITEDDLF